MTPREERKLLTPRKVLHLRYKLNLSRGQLAWTIGASYRTVKAWEIGKALPNTSSFILLDLLDAGYTIPDAIVNRYRKKHKGTVRWRKPRIALTVDKVETGLLIAKRGRPRKE